MSAFGSSYTIITDASVDIDLDIAREGNIKIIPMSYSIGEEMRSFSGVLSPSDYMDFYYSQRQGDLTKTSKLTLEELEKYFVISHERVSPYSIYLFQAVFRIRMRLRRRQRERWKPNILMWISKS